MLRKPPLFDDPRMSLRQRAYDYIRARILEGELAPGDRLSNRQLASEVGSSFIPVREAISQLVSEGFVEQRSGSGCFVAIPSRTDLQDLYDLREALECHAVERAAGFISASDLDEMEELNDVYGAVLRAGEGATEWNHELVEGFLQADFALHLKLLKCCRNARIVRLAGDLRLLSRVFQSTEKYWRRLDDVRRTFDEHAALITALREGDGAKARQVLREHIRWSCGDALAAYDRHRVETQSSDEKWA